MNSSNEEEEVLEFWDGMESDLSVLPYELPEVDAKPYIAAIREVYAEAQLKLDKLNASVDNQISLNAKKS